VYDTEGGHPAWGGVAAFVQVAVDWAPAHPEPLWEELQLHSSTRLLVSLAHVVGCAAEHCVQQSQLGAPLPPTGPQAAPVHAWLVALFSRVFERIAYTRDVDTTTSTGALKRKGGYPPRGKGVALAVGVRATKTLSVLSESLGPLLASCGLASMVDQLCGQALAVAASLTDPEQVRFLYESVAALAESAASRDQVPPHSILYNHLHLNLPLTWQLANS